MHMRERENNEKITSSLDDRKYIKNKLNCNLYIYIYILEHERKKRLLIWSNL